MSEEDLNSLILKELLYQSGCDLEHVAQLDLELNKKKTIVANSRVNHESRLQNLVHTI